MGGDIVSGLRCWAERGSSKKYPIVNFFPFESSPSYRGTIHRDSCELTDMKLRSPKVIPANVDANQATLDSEVPSPPLRIVVSTPDGTLLFWIIHRFLGSSPQFVELYNFI